MFFFFLFIKPKPTNNVITPPSNPFCFIESPVSGNLFSLCAGVPLCLVTSDVALNVD